MFRYHLTLLFTVLPISLLAHSGHGEQAPLGSDDSDWATRHLAEEHHISNFDAGAFFTLHDFDSSLTWTPDEIRRMYGLDDESMKGVEEAKKVEVVAKTMEKFDKDDDGAISRAEFWEGWKGGTRLEDFGVSQFDFHTINWPNVLQLKILTLLLAGSRSPWR